MFNKSNKSDSELSPLREELRMSEGARLDFMKYKLIAVATLAAVALGLKEAGENDPDQHRYVLTVIPFVCVYVDALCYHNNLRIFVIAKYLRCNGDSYEGFLDKWSQVLKEKSGKTVGFFFKLEDLVLDISTRVLAGFLIVAGIVSSGVNLSDRCTVIGPSTVEGIIISLSGLLGFILSVIMEKRYDVIKDEIFRDSCAEINKKTLSGK